MLSYILCYSDTGLFFAILPLLQKPLNRFSNNDFKYMRFKWLKHTKSQSTNLIDIMIFGLNAASVLLFNKDRGNVCTVESTTSLSTLKFRL